MLQVTVLAMATARVGIASTAAVVVHAVTTACIFLMRLAYIWLVYDMFN